MRGWWLIVGIVIGGCELQSGGAGMDDETDGTTDPDFDPYELYEP